MPPLICFLIKVVTEVASGPETPDLIFSGVGMSHADACHAEHLAHTISTEYAMDLLSRGHIAIQPAQDFFSFSRCVARSHINQTLNTNKSLEGSGKTPLIPTFTGITKTRGRLCQSLI